MAITLIAACAGDKQVIGYQGQLPWHFPSDLKFFKATTLGHPVVMGRKTFDAIVAQFGRPLPDRRHLIVTRDRAYRPMTGEVFHDIPAALAAVPKGVDIFVIGGQQIFEQTLLLADKILLTHIDRDYPGDAFFPALDPKIWHRTDERPIIEKDTTLRFCTYIRK